MTLTRTKLKTQHLLDTLHKQTEPGISQSMRSLRTKTSITNSSTPFHQISKHWRVGILHSPPCTLPCLCSHHHLIFSHALPYHVATRNQSRLRNSLKHMLTEIYRLQGRDLDFNDPAAVKQLTKTLLRHDFGLQIELPDDRLCPPVRFTFFLHC